MDRNAKLLWGVIGFAVFLGLVLPSTAPSSPEPEPSESAVQTAPAPPPHVAVQPAPAVEMSAEMPTDFTIDAQPGSAQPVGISGEPMTGGNAAPTPSYAAPSPPPPAPSHTLQGAVEAPGGGPRIDTTILR